jgi:hypothetical protein
VRNRWTRRIAVLAVLVPIAALAASGSGSGATKSRQSARAVSGNITFDGVWTGA